MCGRFTLRTPQNVLSEQFQASIASELEHTPRFNIAPTQRVVAVVGTGDARQLVSLRWGLIPFWAKDEKIGNRLINARAETVSEKPAFRHAFSRRRCLVLADGYYEWKKPASGRGRKQPYHFHRADDKPFAFAGLWERWRQDAATIDSCAIITTDADELNRPIHDRMPVILEPEDYDPWLDTEFEGREALLDMLRSRDHDDMEVNPVSTLVNNPGNDSPDCLRPPS
jgi:putative SOS response-associated peptidase YedK